MSFQRARSDEQRDERRRAILATAAQMLTEAPVASVSLNELSRRVGLAKSNVLRYFESREAILLELLDRELSDWAAAVDESLPASDLSVRERGDRLADRLATELAGRPVLCDLISAQAAVLERNISTEVALRHKYATAGVVRTLLAAFARALPELSPDEAYEIVAITLLLTSGTWPQSQPSEALRAAYASDPAVAATQMDFTGFVRRTLQISVSGILARRA